MINTAMSYGKEYHITIDEEFALLKLQEEVGELAQAVLIHRKKARPEKFLPEEKSKAEIGKELADVVGMAVLSAHLMSIDLEKAIDEKWVNRK